MKSEYKDSLQYRFTAYLLTALDNQIARYKEKKSRLLRREYINIELSDKEKVSEFEGQLQLYKYEQYTEYFKEKNRIQIILDMLNEHKLAKAVGSLKDKEKAILFARIFGELTFGEIGKMFDMSPRQTEMAYFYIIRKLRKRIGE